MVAARQEVRVACRPRQGVRGEVIGVQLADVGRGVAQLVAQAGGKVFAEIVSPAQRDAGAEIAVVRVARPQPDAFRAGREHVGEAAQAMRVVGVKVLVPATMLKKGQLVADLVDPVVREARLAADGQVRAVREVEAVVDVQPARMAVVFIKVIVLEKVVGVGLKPPAVGLVAVLVVGEGGLQDARLREGVLVEEAGRKDVGVVVARGRVGERALVGGREEALAPALVLGDGFRPVNVGHNIVLVGRHPAELELAQVIVAVLPRRPRLALQVADVRLRLAQLRVLVVEVIIDRAAVEGVARVAHLEIGHPQALPPRDVMPRGHFPIDKRVGFLFQLDVHDLLVAFLQVAGLDDVDDLDRLDLPGVDGRDVLVIAVTVDEDERPLAVRHPDLPVGHVGIQPRDLPQGEERIAARFRLLGEVENLARGRARHLVGAVARDRDLGQVDVHLRREEEILADRPPADRHGILRAVVAREKGHEPVAPRPQSFHLVTPPPVGQGQGHQRVARAQRDLRPVDRPVPLVRDRAIETAGLGVNHCQTSKIRHENQKEKTHRKIILITPRIYTQKSGVHLTKS